MDLVDFGILHNRVLVANAFLLYRVFKNQDKIVIDVFFNTPYMTTYTGQFFDPNSSSLLGKNELKIVCVIYSSGVVTFFAADTH